MRELIAKLEAAREGSRELDEAIKRVCGVTVPFSHMMGALGVMERPEWTGSEYLPFFTTSLDAVLTLVPQGLPFALHRGRNGTWAAEIVPLDDDDKRLADIEEAPTAALALCIAGLKAREAHRPREGRGE